MKTVFALAALAAILAPTAYSIGQARDPRVPALARRVATLQRQISELRVEAAQVQTAFVDQAIDERVFAFCRALVTTESSFSSVELASEPAFASFLNAVATEGSTDFACATLP